MSYHAGQVAAQLLCMHVARDPRQDYDLSQLLVELTTYLELRHRLFNLRSEPGMAIITPFKYARHCVIHHSYMDDVILCLEDGKQVKMLKRHLKMKYDMTPKDYCGKWDLPGTYPMIAPSYGRARSRMAKHAGLGRPQHEEEVRLRRLVKA